MKLKSSTPRGTILSFKEVEYPEALKFRDAHFLWIPTEQEIKVFIEEDLRYGLISEQQVDDQMDNYRNGSHEDLIERGMEADIYEMTTTKGVFYLVAQEMDGYGCLTVVELEQ